ncbi:hypothetical protein SLEP1_g41116 [Rubroshorea leprosula]|uniref:Uncharacterized protein n=1 Tax=Rubroshorea leprosula TaxID=152421 RepID=A0AAV5L5X9_9ROSI|nr:hypothetical protein SLEP1_g41116 [Rubroshorea leprosula]
MWGLELSLKPDFFRSAALPSLSVTCSWLGENESSVLGFDCSVTVALGLSLMFCVSEEAKPRTGKVRGVTS